MSEHICGIGHVEGCRACVEDAAERDSGALWEATYNAALTGICTRINLEALPLPDHSDYDVDHVDLHQFAWNCATQAHGEKP